MKRLDKRAPFTATGGIIPPEFQNIKTPCYILDEKALTENAKLLGEVAERTGCKMLLAQKAFSNYDCYPFFEPYLAGTEASGLYEARLGAEEMAGKEVHVFCAGYRADEFEELLQYADHIVFNSPSQLLRFGRMAKEAGKSVGLRINPECSTQEGHEIYDPCAPGSRMGTTRVQWDEAIVKNPELMELLDGVHFHMAQEEWKVEVYLEPGEAWALNAGFLLTSVLDVLKNGDTQIAIVDASAACHMPDVLEMPYRPPLLGASDETTDSGITVRLGGPTCLSGDIIGDYKFSKLPEYGDLLLFGDMAIYTTCKNNTFNGMPLPDIWIRHADRTMQQLTAFDYTDFKERLGSRE